MENSIPLGESYDVVFSLLQPLKFKVTCGSDELQLPSVPVVLDEDDIVISEEEENVAARRWECCLMGYTIGLNPHLPSLYDFLSWKWELSGTLQLIGRGKGVFMLMFSEKDDRDIVLAMGNHSVKGHLFLSKGTEPE